MTIHPPAPWICAQIGAREHYAVPRVLHHAGSLSALYTDFWAGPLTQKLLPAGGPLDSLASRFHSGLARAPVRSFNVRSLLGEAGHRLKSRSSEDRYFGYCEAGQQFASRVRDKLRHRHDLSSEKIFFAYDTGALETLEFLRDRGVRCVLDQMDPNRVEVNMVIEEEKRWPGWASQAIQVPEAYFSRREREWALADRVVVNSNFSRQALIQQGVPAEKVVVIPLCYEAKDDGWKREGEGSQGESRHPGSRRKPLKVLFLGQVILRKGIQYLLEAAKSLRNEPVYFDVVGPIGLSEDTIKSAPSNVTFHGRASRDQAGAWYRQADVFVLPTLSDGFALTQIEAMAHGLPVIATSNCGEVVTDGRDGFIVPPRDADTLARTLVRYLENRELLRAHQKAARGKAGQFTLRRLAENLAALQGE